MEKLLRVKGIVQGVGFRPFVYRLAKELNLQPIINAGMRLGEGTGAVALMPILDMANAVYNYAASFEDISVEAYQKQC